MEAVSTKVSVNSTIPLVGCMFESVERLVELADVVRSLGVDVALRLCHVDHFSKWCVEECCLDIHLMDHEGEKELEVLNAYNRSKGL